MQLIWTGHYNKSLEDIFTCSRDYYSKKTLRQLRSGIGHCESLLVDNPLMGAVEPSLKGMEYEYRNYIIKPHFKIIYRVEEDKIYFMQIWDTRRDPNTLIKSLSL